jgi:hypothetical protein
MAMTNFIPTIWDETIHREKVAKDVFAENCNRKYEGTLAEKGDSVKILGVKAPTIKTLGKNVRNDGIDDAEDIVEDSVTMHINQIAYYNYKVSDFDKRESVDGVMEAEKEALKVGIKFIRGIEISTFDDEHPSIHVLGLGLQDLSVFNQIQQQNRVSRKKRIEK